MAFLAQFNFFYPLGVVSVESLTATSYEEIQASMGSFYYGLKEIYLKANSNEQILSGIVFNTYDSNGTLKAYSENPTVSPYQFQKSVFIKPTIDGVVFDGRTNMNLDILPAEVVFLTLEVAEVSNGVFQGEKSIINEFFDDYVEEL